MRYGRRTMGRVFLLIALSATLACGSHIRTRELKATRLPGIDANSPVTVGLVWAGNEEVVSLLRTIEGRGWEARILSLMSDFRTALDYESWEFAPCLCTGCPACTHDLRIPDRFRDGAALFIYADYENSGQLNRERVDQLRSVEFALERDGLVLQVEPQR